MSETLWTLKVRSEEDTSDLTFKVQSVSDIYSNLMVFLLKLKPTTSIRA